MLSLSDGKWIKKLVRKMERNIMTKLDDYIARQEAARAELQTSIDGITGDIATLTKTAADLRAALEAGAQMTDEQSNRLEALTSGIEQLAQKAKALDDANPAAVEPPPVVTEPVAEQPAEQPVAQPVPEGTIVNNG